MNVCFFVFICAYSWQIHRESACAQCLQKQSSVFSSRPPDYFLLLFSPALTAAHSSTPITAHLFFISALHVFFFFSLNLCYRECLHAASFTVTSGWESLDFTLLCVFHWRCLNTDTGDSGPLSQAHSVGPRPHC